MDRYEYVMKGEKWKSDRDIGQDNPAALTGIRCKYENLKRMIEIHPEISGTAILEFPNAGGRIFLTRSSFEMHILRDWGNANMILLETSFTTLDLKKLPVYDNVALFLSLIHISEPTRPY